MSEIVEKFKYLIDKAQFFQKLKDDQQVLFDEILKIPLKDIEDVQSAYVNEEKIKKIRYEAANLLLNHKFNQQSFEELKERINSQYETNILNSWKNFSILYVFFFNPIKKQVDQYLEDIGNYLVEKSGKNLKLKTTNFDGAQNFGEVGCWLALYNPKYKSQSEGIQYFINFYHENTTYGTYKHENKKDFDRKSYSISNLDEKLIHQIINDIKSQANLILENETGGQKPSMKTTTSPLNQILYGPPGTGKTYNTITKALEIIDGTVPKERKEAKVKFEEYRKSGQIEFITFHQSYGYEEFVEGIRAIPVGEEGNEDGEEMIYAVKDGIFKRMSKKSLENYTKNNHTVSTKRKFLLHAKTLNIQAEMIEEDPNTYRVLKGSKIRKGQAASFENYNYVALKNKLLGNAKLKEETEFYILEEDYIFQSMSAASSVILGRQSNGYNDWKEISDENNLFTQDQEKRNFILIIDEINRGNISKIFGELITLIEPSKRIGADEAIKLKLPYSNEEFGVPQNLYIIGTMNTADRSIALMDTALRRRFHFEEMMPDLETLSDSMIEGIELKKILSKINQRVEYLYDRDHTIGHAYFIDVKSKDDLDDVMRNKIFPLLQEYFYDDWEKIRMVLGDGFIDKIEIKSDIFDYKPDEYLEDEKFIYSIKESFDYTKLQS